MAIDPAPDFPKPEWPPIQDLDSLDIVGKRRDGGVDLVIAVSQPLDGSANTLDAIRRKIGYYLDVIDEPEFQREIGDPPRDRTSIILSCGFPIHPWAAEVIAECQTAAARRGVRVAVQE